CERQRLGEISLAALGIGSVGIGSDVAAKVQRMGCPPEMMRRRYFHRAVAQSTRVVESAERKRGPPQPKIDISEIGHNSARGMTPDKSLTFEQPAQGFVHLAKLRQNRGGRGERY